MAAGAGHGGPPGAHLEGRGRREMQAERSPAAGAGHAAALPRRAGWDEDQCWTLARITEVVRRRFGVDYTLAGMDLLLHRISWSVQVPARRAAERDEAAIAAWREETWPVINGRRRTWRLDRLRRRVWPGPEAAEGPYLGAAPPRW